MLILAARTACLLGAGAALGLLVNAARPDGVRFASFAAPNSCGSGAVAAAPGVPPVEVVAPALAAGLCGDPGTLLADVRPADAFARGHATGAIHLPCAASGSVATAAAGLLTGRHTLVVYGDGTDDAQLVADEMRRRVSRSDLRVLVLDGGFPAWSRSGLACSSGPCADCQASGHR
jgi:rhodanese-related sulfurtransferase